MKKTWITQYGPREIFFPDFIERRRRNETFEHPNWFATLTKKTETLADGFKREIYFNYTIISRDINKFCLNLGWFTNENILADFLGKALIIGAFTSLDDAIIQMKLHFIKNYYEEYEREL